MNVREHNEVDTIRDAYAPREASKLDDLKKLDKKARTPAAVFGWIFGIVGALVLGVGMCFALEALGHNRMQLGVAIGCVGIAMVVSNYFFYKAMRKAGKAKYGERILALSDELLHENEKH